MWDVEYLMETNRSFVLLMPYSTQLLRMKLSGYIILKVSSFCILPTSAHIFTTFPCALHHFNYSPLYTEIGLSLGTWLQECCPNHIKILWLIFVVLLLHAYQYTKQRHIPRALLLIMPTLWGEGNPRGKFCGWPQTLTQYVVQTGYKIDICSRVNLSYK